jgi:hypothetical protein
VDSAPLKMWWNSGGQQILDRVGNAERRFNVVVDAHLGDVAGLAACDELAAATSSASDLIAAHPCPDDEAQGLITTVLSAYTQVAHLMGVAVSATGPDRDRDREAIIARVNLLRQQIVTTSARLPARILEILGAEAG